mgnify:CR=1 FL=1
MFNDHGCGYPVFGQVNHKLALTPIAMNFAVLALAFIGAFALGPILHGWALSTLWSWFISPIFSAPNLPIPSAIGIALIIQLAVRTEFNEKKSEVSDASELLVAFLVKVLMPPVFAVGYGWLIRSFI